MVSQATLNAGCKVLITQDCRDENSATGKLGVYEGDFYFSVIVKISEEVWREYLYDEFIEGKIAFEDGRKLVDVIPELNKPGMEPPFWFPHKNPRIRLDDGSIIWGCQCWWCSADDKGELPTLEEGKHAQSKTIEMLTNLLKTTEE